MAKKNSDNEKSTSGGIKKILVIVLALLVLGAGGFVEEFTFICRVQVM